MNKWILGLLFSMTANAASMDGRQIMLKNEEVRKVRDVQSQATLTTGEPGASDKTKQFTWWRKLQSDSVHFHTFTRFQFPPEVRGEGILFLERAGEDGNEVLLYLPTFKKIRRVENQQQSGSFMSSEFSYSDITTPHVDDYKYQLKREEKCPEAEAAQQTCYVVVSEPANDSVRDRTGYNKSELWIRKDNFMMVKADHYNAGGEKFKTMLSSKISEVDKVDHKWLAHLVKMENLKTKRYTTLLFENVKANVGIADSIFTQQNLQKEK